MSLDNALPSPKPSVLQRVVGPWLPLVFFGLVEVTALPLLLAVGRRRWFRRRLVLSRRDYEGRAQDWS